MVEKLPDFESDKEERDFWSDHDSTDFLDWSQARRVTLPNLKPSTRVISLRVPEALIDQVKVLANASDLPYQSLMKMLLADRVRQELEKRKPRGRWTWLRFRLGDAFSPDSMLSIWIVGLATIANDLIVLHDPLAQDKKDAGPNVYMFWVACAQYREAAKFLASGLEQPEVRRFNDRLGPEHKLLWSEIRSSFEPWEGSFVQSVLKPVRDRLFHYPDVQSHEWRDLLSGYVDTEGSVCFRGSHRIRDTHAEFVDDLRAGLLARHLGLTHDEIAGSMSRLAQLIIALVRVSHSSLAAYLGQIPRDKINVEAEHSVRDAPKRVGTEHAGDL